MRTRDFLGFNYSAVCASHGPSFTRVIEGDSGWVSGWGGGDGAAFGHCLRPWLTMRGVRDNNRDESPIRWQWPRGNCRLSLARNARHISRHDSSQELDFASIDRDGGLNLTGKLRFPPLSRLVCFSRALNVIISSSTSTSTTITLDGSRWKYAESCILACLCNVYSRIVRGCSGTVDIFPPPPLPPHLALSNCGEIRCERSLGTTLSLCHVLYFNSLHGGALVPAYVALCICIGCSRIYGPAIRYLFS